MGVHTLWRLLDCVSRPTTTDEWRGKVVAVDASVWMAQFRSVSNQRRGGGRFHNDDDGGDHQEDGSTKQLIEGFVNRILKLLYFDITPVIVFDGPSSQLKAREKERRRWQQQQHHHDEVVRRARRIVAAQVSTGVLSDAVLAALPRSASARGQRRLVGSPRKRPLDAHRDTPRLAAKVAASPSRRFRARRRRMRTSMAVVIAPERISRELTSSYLNESGVYLKSKHQGDATNAANLLRSSAMLSSGSSLFLGSRSVLEGEAAVGQDDGCAPLHDAVPVDDRSPHFVVNDCSADECSSGSSSDGVQITANKPHSWVQRSNDDSDGVVDDEDAADLRERWSSSTNTTVCRTSTSTTIVTIVDSSSDDDNPSEGDPSGASDCQQRQVRGTALDGEYWSAYDVEKRRSNNCTTVMHLDDEDGSSNSVVYVAPNNQPRSEACSIGSHQNVAVPRHEVSTGVNVATPLPPIRPTYRHTDVIPLELLELVELLRLCDVSYVVSPAEADAQCAYLNARGIVDAVFTEDSDVVVHGASTVLRGFFTQAGVSAVHKADLDACGVHRGVLLALTQLLGCDYAPGVGGMSLSECLQLIACLAERHAARNSSGVEEEEWSAVAASLQVLRRWLAILQAAAASISSSTVAGRDGAAAAAADGDDAMDDLTLAQRAVARSLLKGKWSKWVAPLVDGASATSKHVLPRAFPDPHVALMFTRHVPVDNVAIPTRPTTPRPDWPGLGRFLANRGLQHLRQKAELARREMEKRAAAVPDGAIGGNGHDTITRYLTMRQRETAQSGPARGLAAIMALRAQNAFGGSSQRILEGLQLMAALLGPQ